MLFYCERGVPDRICQVSCKSLSLSLSLCVCMCVFLVQLLRISFTFSTQNLIYSLIIALSLPPSPRWHPFFILSLFPSLFSVTYIAPIPKAIGAVMETLLRREETQQGEELEASSTPSTPVPYSPSPNAPSSPYASGLPPPIDKDYVPPKVSDALENMKVTETRLIFKGI